MCGTDIPLPEFQLILHQPTIKEIAYLGEDNFFSALTYLCLNKNSLIADKKLQSEVTNFQVLMEVLKDPKIKEIKQNILLLFKILFQDYKTVMTPNSIIFTSSQGNVMIDNENFEIFQAYIKDILCLSNVFQGDNIIYNPANKLAEDIVNKIMAGRKKVAELNAKQQKESVLSRYLSILTVGIPIDLSILVDLTLFQLFDLVQRYMLKQAWDIDFRVRIAGGSPKKEAEDWMQNIH